MNLLGISCYYHDAAAALVRDGDVIAAAQEERFTRIKHDPRFPATAIEFCLRQGEITPQELDYVVFYEKPLLKFERILLTTLRTFPRSWRTYSESMTTWLQEKLWIRSLLQQRLAVPAERILFIEHHLSHAASAFFCSPFEEAAILTADGVGEWATTTVGTARGAFGASGGSSIELTRELAFPHSLGLLYSVFTAFLGFEVNEGEYKVMGMAPYGEPRYQDKVRHLLRASADGSFELDLSYFTFHYSAERSFGRRFAQLFGDPRSPDAEFITRLTHPYSDLPARVFERNQYYADVAASIQRVTEDLLVRMAQQLQRETGLTKLCMAGGVALNSVANSRVLRESGFDELFIQPAAGDAGGALGAALYTYHVLLGRPRRYVMETAYLGAEADESQVHDFLEHTGIPYQAFDDEEQLLDVLVDDLVRGRVLGWHQGRFEWGPRALGGRSIIADPRRADMKEVVNDRIKFRELFRPFAPAIPEESAPAYFEDLPTHRCGYATRYMLMVWPWQLEAGKRVPAVNHLGTGRLQTVRAEWNPRYHGLLRKFGEATGVPVLMNTSFNLRGEPIVNTPLDAWRTFVRSKLDTLVLGNCVVRRSEALDASYA